MQTQTPQDLFLTSKSVINDQLSVKPVFNNPLSRTGSVKRQSQGEGLFSSAAVNDQQLCICLCREHREKGGSITLQLSSPGPKVYTKKKKNSQERRESAEIQAQN